MNIKEYMSFQDDDYEEIVNIANSIDPKLIGILTYEDLFNDKYRDYKLEEWYHKLVSPKVRMYKEKCKIFLDDVLCDTINNASLVLPSTGYLTNTGEETYQFDGKIPYDYVPCIDLEGIVHGIQMLEHRYLIDPFWDRTVYRLSGNNETITIYPEASSLIRFIDNNRNKFRKSFGESNLGIMERYMRIRESKFDYEICIPQLSPLEDRHLTGKYEEAVRRHLILQKLMEDECTGLSYSSTIDLEGNVTLEEEQ
jgi:hypothetical protein